MAVRRSTILTAIVVGMLVWAQPALSMPITVDFTATVSSVRGDFLGAAGAVSGSFTYDSDGSGDSNASPSVGFYGFSGAPYGFSVQVDGFGSLSNTTTLVEVGDDGAVLPDFDTFQVGGFDGVYLSRIDWTGATSSFSGDTIPDTSVLGSMNPLFIVNNINDSGTPQLMARINSISFSAVPEPASAWLLGAGLALLAGMLRRGRVAGAVSVG